MLTDKQSKPSAKLCVHVALAAEAKPLLAVWRLQKVGIEAGMTRYANRDGSIHLLVSGPGKVAAAMAVALLCSDLGQQQMPSVLNVGIAGHASAAIGSLWRIDQVFDVAADRTSYAGGVIRSDLSCMQAQTRDRFIAGYPATALVDMEAAGVLEAARRFVVQEQVEILKIISDNAMAPIDKPKQLTRAHVTDLVAQHVVAIDQVAQDLLALSAQESEIYSQYHINIDAFLTRWHFTVSQRYQLQRHLRRVRVQYGQQAQHALALCDAISAREVLSRLAAQYPQPEVSGGA